MIATPALATSADTAENAAPMDTSAPAVTMDRESSIFLKTSAVNDLFGSALIGKALYASERDSTGVDKTALDQDWDNVGEINDLLLGGDGEVKAVLLDIGGFLGIGEKTVAVDMSELSFINDGDENSDYFVTVALSKTMLENAPEFDRMSSNETTAMTTDHTMSDGTTTAMTMDEAWDRPATARDGYVIVAETDVTAEDLQGASIYGANDALLGEIEELIIGSDGNVETALADIGGFLGIGEKRIEISYDELQIMREGDGDDLIVFVSATQEQLEKRPEANPG
jgi:hypothetical protein